MLKVKKIIGKLLSSNMYLLFEEGNANCWLVDIGDFSALEENYLKNLDVKGIFLTHSHFDHISGINDLCKMFPTCKVYTSEYGKEGLYSSKKNFSFYHDLPIEYEGKNIVILHEGDIIELFDNIDLHVVETPGHCPSCLTYYTDNYVFTGDSYIPDIPVVTKLPKGNKSKSIDSIDKILDLSRTRQILAGHDKDKWISIL